MKRLELLTLFALIYGLSFTLTGCEKNTLKDVPNFYEGKWKVKSVRFGWTLQHGYPLPPVLEFSESDYVYNFQIDNYMYVSGKMPELDSYSDTERVCFELYLRHGFIETGRYKYKSSIYSFNEETGWVSWNIKIGDTGYYLIAHKDLSRMSITKTFPFNELPWGGNVRTYSFGDVPSSSSMDINLEKVEEPY